MSRKACNRISQMTTGTYPIGRHLRKIGVKAYPTCPCCKAAEDTIQHRLWHCPELKELRDEHIPVDVQRWAKAGGQHELLACMCLGTKEYKDETATAEVTQKWQAIKEDGTEVVASTEAELKKTR